MTASPAAVPAAPALPASAWRLIVLEFWERFSYYGILAILVLFLTGPMERGGFGWSDSRALDLLSIFAAIAFILPMVGGYVADQWLGTRRAVLIGSCLLVAGNIAIAAAAILHASPGTPSGAAPGTNNVATTPTMMLYAGLAAVALGNGFFKSSLVTLLGSLIEGDDAARDRAFRYYYQAIMLGALAASLVVGALAENIGWWSGFALAAAGMAISFAIFAIWPPSASRPAPVHCVDAGSDGESLTHATMDVAILCAFLVVITVGWVQFQGLWLLEMEHAVDRTIGTLTVPPSWLLSVNAIVVVLFTPASGRLWRRLTGNGEPAAGFTAPGFTAQFAAAFALMGSAHLLMALGFREPASGNVSLLWPVGCVLMITVGELIFWPSSYNAIHRLAPARSKSLMMGIWLATLGLGQYITHQVGRTAETLGFSTLSGYIGMAMLAACVAVMMIARLRPTLRAL
jgi:POT family proton-dependent oligopeptide transporter